MPPRKSVLKVVPTTAETVKFLNLDQISVTGETQQRPLKPDHVEQMVEALKEGRPFPRGKAVWDRQTYWIYDGFHQLEARKQAGFRSMEFEVIEGDLRQAQWLSFRANIENNALPRTREDLLKIARAIYADPEWKEISRNAIAKHTGIGEAKLRVWEKQDLLTTRNATPVFTITTSDGGRRTYDRANPKKPKRAEPGKAEAAAIKITAQRSPEPPVIIPSHAPNFPRPEEFHPQVLPELGTFQMVGRHHIYCGNAGDRQFQEDLPAFSVGFVTIPYGWADWDYEWVWDICNVVAVIIEEPISLYQFCKDTKMKFQSALFTNFEGKPSWVGLFARNPLDDLDNGVKGSADLLLRGLSLLYAPRSSDTVLVINRPSTSFHPIIAIEEAGKELWFADENREAIAREIQNHRIGFSLSK